MPVRISKLPSGKVRVSTPGGVKSKSTTMANALAQKRIIEAADAGHPISKLKRRR